MRLDHLDVQKLGAKKPHGDRVKYMSGCRCMLCRAANSRYETERAAARRRGEGNHLVSAAAARRHVRKLSLHGIGYKSVAAAASVSKTVMWKIRTGKRAQIRKQTEQRILAVTRDAYGAGNLLDADPTWAKINRLLDEGFSKAELARRLGLKSPALQFKTFEVTGRTKMRVDRFYAQIMAEA